MQQKHIKALYNIFQLKSGKNKSHFVLHLQGNNIHKGVLLPIEEQRKKEKTGLVKISYNSCAV